MTTQQTTKNTRTFLAAVTQLSEKEHTATFYLMNTSPNRNDWAVTDQALEEALPTLQGKPIGLGKGYKLGHFKPEDSIDAGTFISYEKPGSYAKGTTKYHDEKVWAMLKSGEASAISTVIEVYKEHCSQCGEDLAPYQAHWHEHNCIKSGKAHSLISSFKFIRFDHVGDPAYPQAGVLDMSASLQLCAEFYTSQNKPKLTGESTLTDQDTKKLADLEEANKTLKQQYEAAAKKAGETEQTVKDLRAELDSIKKAQHEALVAEVYEARKTAGLADKEEAEKQMLTAQTDAVLQIMKADAHKTAAKIQAATENPPKAKYGATLAADTNEVAEAVKTQRASFGLKTEQAKETE